MSKITVTTIAGQTSGSDANKVKIESGDELDIVNGDLTVNTNKLFVDASTDLIGIGTTSPATTTGGGIDIHRNGGSSVRIDDTTNSVTGEFQVYSAGLNLATVTNHNLVLSTNNSAKMTIDGSGRITEPLQPSFLAKGALNSYITTSPIPFPTVSGGGVNMAAHNIGGHYNTSNYTFTAPIAGRYFFHVHLGIVRGATNQSQMYPTLLVNGNGVAYAYAKIEATPTANHYMNCSVTQVLSLSANDAVKVNFNQSGTGSYYNGASESSFMGYLLG